MNNEDRLSKMGINLIFSLFIKGDNNVFSRLFYALIFDYEIDINVMVPKRAGI